jgi:hypothetical protein
LAGGTTESRPESNQPDGRRQRPLGINSRG